MYNIKITIHVGKKSIENVIDFHNNLWDHNYIILYRYFIKVNNRN